MRASLELDEHHVAGFEVLSTPAVTAVRRVMLDAVARENTISSATLIDRWATEMNFLLSTNQEVVTVKAVNLHH